VNKSREITISSLAIWSLGEGCTLSISRAIRDFTTRKHYPGLHLIQLMVNGEALAETAFELSI